MFSKKFLKNIKERLLVEKQERLKRSDHRVEIDTEGDETDEIQGSIQIDLHNQFTGLNNVKLSLIEEALKRINDKTYGICIDCGEDIIEKRLLENPYFLTCVSCAEAREIKDKQRKK